MNHDYIGSFWQCQMSQKPSDQQRQVPVVCHQHESVLNPARTAVLSLPLENSFNGIFIVQFLIISVQWLHSPP